MAVMPSNRSTPLAKFWSGIKVKTYTQRQKRFPSNIFSKASVANSFPLRSFLTGTRANLNRFSILLEFQPGVRHSEVPL